MAVLKPRNRLVYFRVSEEEFHQLQDLCERQQARSISDLARHAMVRLLTDADDGPSGAELTPRVTLLGKLIAEVSLQLQQLTLLQQRDGNGLSASLSKPDPTGASLTDHHPGQS